MHAQQTARWTWRGGRSAWCDCRSAAVGVCGGGLFLNVQEKAPAAHQPDGEHRGTRACPKTVCATKQKPTETVCLPDLQEEVRPVHQPGRGAPQRAGCTQPGLENHRSSCYLIIPFLLQDEVSAVHQPGWGAPRRVSLTLRLFLEALYQKQYVLMQEEVPAVHQPGRGAQRRAGAGAQSGAARHVHAAHRGRAA